MLPFASVWKRVCLKNKRPCSFCGTMAFYQERIIPWLIHLSMRQRMLAPYRDRVVSSARGRVLEVGIGSGLNLPFYASAATEIIGLDPSPKLLEMANKAARTTPIPLRLVEGTAEAIPIEDHDVDAVVTTWTMCSIPEIQSALQEMRGTETGRSPFLCRAWARAVAASALVAGSSHPSLEASLWWLSPESRDRRTGRECRFSHRAARSRIYARTQTDDVHV
jgi:SAM-dependent methyltransferase